jgi:hypothetical protein
MIRESPPPRLARRSKRVGKDMSMIETYRMLGAEREADLAREAKRRQQAPLAQLKAKRPGLASIYRAYGALRRTQRLREGALRHSLTDVGRVRRAWSNRCA